MRIQWLCVFWCLVGSLQAAVPDVSFLFPAGGQRGTTFSVTATGKFDWPVQVDAPGFQVALGSESGKLDVTIPSDLPVGRVWLRLFNTDGASNLMPLLVSDLPELIEAEPNDAPQSAQVVQQLPVIVNGVLKGADTDAFSVPLEAGQTLVAAIDAHSQLGSPIDSVLQITLPNGIVVADNHDSLGLDPRVTYTAQQSGRVLVRVFGFASEPNQSIALQGGANCIYRLTMTVGAYITHATTLAVSNHLPGDVELLGWNIPPGTRTALPADCGGGLLTDAPSSSDVIASQCSLSEREPTDSMRISPDARMAIVTLPQAGGWARVRVVPYSTLTRMRDLANDRAMPLELPTSVTGCLHDKAQRDRYHVHLQAGQTLVATAESQNFGLLPDLLLRLSDATGKQIAEVDDSGGLRDAVLNYTATIDGDFMLTVSDRFGAGNDRAYYLLTANIEQPDFELTVAADRLTIPATEPAELPIAIVRRGAAGPITIRAVGLPEGITAEVVESPIEGDAAKNVKLKLSGNGQAYSGWIQVVGEMSQPIPRRRVALAPPRLGTAFSNVWVTALPQQP
ncbi:MAG: PPC domain-containing protein [Pirellulaceae bacterium]|nr:PPC domain-containing protein [Pirellulaceae bacterium]